MSQPDSPRTLHMDGPCPLLLCLETGPHDHPICPSCGAVDYGNIDCVRCAQNRQPINEQYLAALKRFKETTNG